MAQILVRDLDDEVVDRLKERAKRNNRSLQGEVKTVLQREADDEAARERKAAKMDAMIDKWQQRWAREGKTFSDSTEIIRELRDEE